MIVQVFRDVVNSLGSPLPFFNVGNTSYQNLQGDTVNIDTYAIWLLPFSIDQTFQQNGVFWKRYNVIIHFGDLTKQWDDTKELEAHIEAMDGESDRFLVFLENHALVEGRDTDKTGLLNIRKEPIYMTQDLNLTGYAVSLQVTLKSPAFDYCDTTIVPFDPCVVNELTCEQLEDLSDSQHACIVPNILSQTLLDNFTAAQEVAIIAALCNGADVTIKINGAAWDIITAPAVEDIPVKNENGVALGSKVGINWEIGDITLIVEDQDAVELFNGSKFAGVDITQVVNVDKSTTLDVFFEDGSEDSAIVTIEVGVNDGDYVAEVLTNVYLVSYEINAVPTALPFTLVDGDALTVIIVRTIQADSNVRITGTHP